MPLGKRSDYGDAKYAGLAVPFSSDVETTVKDASLCGFDFIIAPLLRPDYRPPDSSSVSKDQLAAPFNRDDVLYLSSSQYTNQVVGSTSTWIDADSPDPELQAASAATLKHELAWAAHLGLQAVVLPPPPRPMQAANYARVVHQALSGLSHMALWLTIPLAGPANPESPSGEDDPWEWWNQVRTLCDSSNLLGCLLQVPADLPSAPALLQRWAAEPVKALALDTSVFTTNKRGYPVLSKAHQELVASFLKYGVQLVVSGSALHTPSTPAAPGSSPPGQHFVALDPQAGTGFTLTNPGEAHPARPYWEYCCYMFRKLEEVGEQERLEAGYRDYLQAPLQPLQDNLESQTYEVFEKDVTKYQLYEEAVYRALLDRRDAAGTTGDAQPSSSGSGSEAQQPGHVVLMVVGAGRGPLVRASMQAGKRAGMALRVYAVEKNPNAIIHIQNMLRQEGWQEQVTLVSADMRHWQAPEPADILVSELLGSFSDNELSPECLDGAQRFLRQPGGVSIPTSYTSYLAPMSSHKLNHDAQGYKDLEHLETPYVVKLHKVHLLSTPQPVFTFSHPNWAPNIDNSRYAALTFPRPAEEGSALLHGFAGYFECVLYKDVLLSTRPATHSPNMFSWFPIFFPLREPVYLPAGKDVEVQMWRCVASHKVWYEWAITKPVPIAIHNPSGRSYWVGL